MSTPTLTAATVAERIRTRFLSESGDLSSLMATEVASSQVPGEEHETLALQVRDHLEGLGVLQPFLDDPAIEEIWINGPHSVFVASAGVGRKVDVDLEAAEIRRLIERQRLFALADSAALAGAESFDPAKLSLTSSGIQAPLESARVAAAARNFLSRADSAGLESLVLEAAHTPDGRHTEVRLSSMWAPPVVSDFFPASLRISATARSQVFIH